MTLSFLITVIVLSLGVDCSIVSKSEISTCEKSDSGTDCKSKIFVNLVLSNGQGSNEELAFNISKMQDQDGKEINLDQPLKVSVQKSSVEVSYNTIYLQDVNYNPQERVIDSSYLSCSEGTYLGSLKLTDATCSLKRDDKGAVVKDSQGYCCSCPLLTYLAGVRSGTKRGDCGFLSSSMSAHCLHLPEAWFSLFEIPSYSFNYIITIRSSVTDKFGKELQTDMFLGNTKKSIDAGIFSAKIIGVVSSSN